MPLVNERIGTLAVGLVLSAALPFAANAASASVSIVAPLSAYGGYPDTPLVADQQGNLYGAISTQGGAGLGTGSGATFSLAPDGSTTVLHTFGNAEGYPIGPLVRTSDGSIYGLNPGDGYTTGGTIYKITADGQYSVLHTFGARYPHSHGDRNPDGDDPASLVMGKDGALYGAAKYGGHYGLGTIFRITTDGQFSLVYTLKPYTLSRVNSYQPCSLTVGADGTLYGGTWHASNGDYGSLFKVTPSGHYTELYLFQSSQSTTCPSLMQASDGNLYGTYGTGSAAGTSGGGWIFKMTAGGTLSSLYSFRAAGSYPDGFGPVGLIQATDGKLYGIASSGGSGGVGTLFSITTDGSFTNLYSFPTSLNGQAFGYPVVNVTQGGDGALYGTVVSADGSAPAVFKALITN
jgi:uncharacterized repeat protein (TIGR03803 family)